jgi:hypothetical protein
MDQNSARVDGQRPWESLMDLAQIGATPKGGVCRLALSDLDGEARRRFMRWCRGRPSLMIPWPVDHRGRPLERQASSLEPEHWRCELRDCGGGTRAI